MIAEVDLKGKAALITGAASGLGRATALAFARAGADVCIVDIDAAGLQTAEREIRSLGVEVVVRPADLSRRAECVAAVDGAVNSLGRLDALCNVAGVIFFTHSVEMSEAQWNKTLAVNLSAPFFLSQAAIPHLLKSHGAIVNVSSAGAYLGEAYLAAYTATKAGLVNLTKSMAMEFSAAPIRINAVAPGAMETGMATGIQLPEGADLSLIQRYMSLRGSVAVDDVAGLIRFLASDAARAYHGACLSIDAGITAG